MPAIIETTSQILTAFEELIDDNVDEDLALTLANQVKDKIEGERDWFFLKKVDSSQQVNAGDNYDTSKALPADCLFPSRIYIGDDDTPYLPVGLEEKRRFKDMNHVFVVDWANNVYYLCGNFSSQSTIYFSYVKSTPNLALDNSPVWPPKYRKIISFEMAAIHAGGVDTDDYNRLLSPVQRMEARELKTGMELLDARIRSKEAENLNLNGSGHYDGRINTND